MQSILERLEKLRNVQNWTWEELAEKLELSVSMLMMVRRSERKLSGKAAWRLRNVELQAGLKSEPLKEFIEPGTEEEFGKKNLIYGNPIPIHGEHQPSATTLHEEPPLPSQKNIIAKLRRQVQNMQLQINAITETLEELEK